METSDPLPVEGMQDVQTVDQLRDRTLVPQDSDHLAIHSHSHPLSEAMDDGESDVMHERIAPSESARLHLLFFNAMEAAAGSINKAVRTCYMCCTRWRDESPFPHCHYVLWGGGGACEYCISRQIPCQMVSCAIGHGRYMTLRKNRFQQTG